METISKSRHELEVECPALANWVEIHPVRTAEICRVLINSLPILNLPATCHDALALWIETDPEAFPLQAYLQVWRPESGQVVTKVWRDGQQVERWVTPACEFNRFV